MPSIWTASKWMLIRSSVWILASTEQVFAQCFRLNFRQIHLPFMSGSVKAREPDLEWKILRWASVGQTRPADLGPFFSLHSVGEKWGSKNRRNVFKFLPRSNNNTYNTSGKSEFIWFSSYRDIGQKRNFHTKSLKNSISQRRIRLLDLLTSRLGLLWLLD